MIKALKKLEIEDSYLDIIKPVHDRLSSNIILNLGKLEAFPLKSGIRQGCPVYSYLFNIVLEFLAMVKW
jgi:hypothetical protein